MRAGVQGLKCSFTELSSVTSSIIKFFEDIKGLPQKKEAELAEASTGFLDPDSSREKIKVGKTFPVPCSPTLADLRKHIVHRRISRITAQGGRRPPQIRPVSVSF